MSLTQLQLDIIDRFLEQHQLDFLDFKLEIKDHLATATEELMKEKVIPFEEALLLAVEPWEIELQVKKYWLISNERLFPNFVIQRIKYKVAFHYGMVMTVAIIATFLASNYLIENQKLFKYGIGFCGIIYFLLRRIMNHKKIKTSYRFHFDYFYLPVLLVFAYFFVFKLSFVYANFIGFLVIANFPFTMYYFLKHQQFVKKYQLT
ncbi:MAG: hypothetical protein KA523_06705 [Flavobacterium sp.]|nr:hypothetical protein [Flavobacterium sp.]